MRTIIITSVIAIALQGCGAEEDAPEAQPTSRPAVVGLPGDTRDVASILDACARVHGGAGPFVVAGYRMGDRALKELGQARGAWGVEVTHRCPREVQWSCIADGLQAATGASPGRLSLTLTFAEGATESRVKAGEKTVVLGLTETFLAHFLDTPMDGLAEAGERVAHLPDEEIFWLRIER
jgi:formylmethanofuran dehydrogenase subunit E